MPDSDRPSRHDPNDRQSPAPGGPEPITVRSGPPDGGSSAFRRRAATSMPGPGERVGTFELEADIGAGGMGAVFRATDARLERHVALKLLPPEQAVDPEVVQRFYQEARAAARLDHENIARVYTIGHDEGYHYIAFEYIEGVSIRQRVAEQGPLSLAETVNYSLQIATALVHASERGVVHRDIKPSNIVVTAQGRAKLVDMGLARRFERRGEDDGLTQPGTTLGTFDYISPEQALDPRNVDVRSDLYSLGCTIFHMLAGRPPFPEGTVTQKLLLHQKEPPPDIRALNPAVPGDLATILSKLMAKDPDRRYQTAEQLVRDLLTMAGSLGLRSISPEGLVWMAATPQPAWERHLVWGVPSLTLALVVTFLVWWGQNADNGLDSSTEPTSIATSRPVVDVPHPVRPATGLPATPTRTKSGTETPKGDEKGIVRIPVTPERRLKAGDDLVAALAEAPSGSTITLADDGPFLFGPSGRTPLDSPAKPKDLILRAAPGNRPSVRIVGGTKTAATKGTHAVSFGPGLVRVEGIEFLLEPAEDGSPLAAIQAEGTDLSIRQCTFRRSVKAGPTGEVAGIVLREPERRSEGRPAPVRVEECHFGGGMVGLRIRGPADVQARDCTFGPGNPSFWLDNTGALEYVPARLVLRHVSILAGEQPVFRSSRTAATIRMDDSVIAPPLEIQTTLVAIDDPDRLDWLGRSNLYARVRAFLQPTTPGAVLSAIRSFRAWADMAGTMRENDSSMTEAVVWEQTDPVRQLASAEPGAAFLIAPEDLPEPDRGARFGRLGPIATGGPSGPLGKARGPGVQVASNATKADTVGPTKPIAPRPADPVGDVATRPAPMFRDDAATGATSPMERPPTDVGSADPASPLKDGTPTAKPVDENPIVDPVDDAPAVSRPSGEMIRTARALVDALSRTGAQGTTLKIEADADLELPAVDVKTIGRLTIEGTIRAGARRPRLRFRPTEPLGAARTTLLAIRSGAMELRDIDIVLREEDAPASGRWSAFTVAPGAELSLVHCTVTLVGESPGSAIFAVLSDGGATDPAHPPAGLSSADIRVSDSLLRSGGNLVDLAGDRRLDLELSNTVVSTEGALLLTTGSTKGERLAEADKVVLRQVLARCAGGVVHLASTASLPQLPQVELLVRESILTTSSPTDPLLRIDGQETLEALRDRIKWEGHGVAYHHLEVYRRDQTAEPGTVPLRFDRGSWQVAVGQRDESPFHGDIDFAKPWVEGQPAWTFSRKDAEVRPTDPRHLTGPDLTRIPES